MPNMLNHRGRQRMARQITTFTNRYPFVGPAFWIASVQYYLVQILVARAWVPPYSLSLNTISDLGNIQCGLYAGRIVCSPRHALMNASLIILGLTMIIGAVLIFREFQEQLGSAIGFSFMAIAGLGTVWVGLFPENTIGYLHAIGAALPFLIGNLGMVVLGLVLDIPRWLKFYTVLSGVVSLLALVLFVSHNYLGLGVGGLERIVAYPQTAWLIIFGIYISKTHLKNFGFNHRRRRGATL